MCFRNVTVEDQTTTTVEDYTSVNQLTMSSADFTQSKKWLLTLNSGMSTYSKRSTGTVYELLHFV